MTSNLDFFSQRAGFDSRPNQFSFRPIDDKVFDTFLKARDPRFLPLWDKGEGWNRTYLVLDQMRKAVKLREGVIIRIFGPRRSGKSIGGQTLSLKWENLCYKFWKEVGNISFSFSFSETDNLARRAEFTDVVIQDEITKEVGKGRDTAEINIGNILETMAVKGVCYIFIDVRFKYQDLIMPDILLQTRDIDRKRGTTRFILWNTARFTPPMNEMQKSVFPVMGWVKIKKHSNERLAEAYKIQKTQFVEGIGESGGAKSVRTPTDLVDRDVDRLIKFAKDNPKYVPDYTKDTLKQVVSLAEIKGRTDYQDYIAKLAYAELKGVDSGDGTGTQIVEIVSPQGLTIAEYVGKRAEEPYGVLWGNIFRRILQGEQQVDVARSIETVSQSDISLQKKELGERFFGTWFEQWFRATKNDKRPTAGHGIPDPDCIKDFPYKTYEEGKRHPEVLRGLKNVFSLKTSLDRDKESMKFYPNQHCRPERDHCKEFDIESFVLLYYAPFWKEKWQWQEVTIRLERPQKSISFINGRKPIEEF